MPSTWDVNVTRQAIAEDVYLGYEKKAATQLHKRLPLGDESFEDVLAWMRVYAIEAADKFNPNHDAKAKFDTFLYKHLRIKSMQWFNWAWLPKQHPQGKYVLPFGDDTPQIAVHENRIGDMQERELLNSLSEPSRALYEALTEDPALIDELLNEDGHAAIARRMEIRPELIFDFVQEVRTKARGFKVIPVTEAVR